jgi:adenylosuccinate lyase
LVIDEILLTATSILTNLRVDEAAMTRNLSIYGPFAATERVLMAAAKAGASRQDMHEILREQAMTAWAAVRAGEPNPLVENLCADARLLAFLTPAQIHELMEYSHHVGDAPQRARALAREIGRVGG